MMEINDVNTSALSWKQPNAFRRAFELCWHDDVLATMEWEKPSGSLAVVRSAEGRWTLKRSGFLSPKVTARVAGTDKEAASFRPNWRGEGVLELDESRRFYWVQNDPYWGSRWAFRDELHRPILTVTLNDGLHNILKYEAFVDIDDAVARMPGLSLMAAMGWYVMVLSSGESPQDDEPAADHAFKGLMPCRQ
jgi:hypothetical protein